MDTSRRQFLAAITLPAWLEAAPDAIEHHAGYLAALSPDWMSRVHSSPDDFRRQIGLEPQHGFAVADMDRCPNGAGIDG